LYRHSPDTQHFPYSTLFRSANSNAVLIIRLIMKVSLAVVSRRRCVLGEAFADSSYEFLSAHFASTSSCFMAGKEFIRAVSEGFSDRKSTRLNSSHVAISYSD